MLRLLSDVGVRGLSRDNSHPRNFQGEEVKTPKSLQVGAEEVTTLEKWQGHFENPGLIGFEREFLGAR